MSSPDGTRPPPAISARWSAYAVDDPNCGEGWQLAGLAPWPPEAHFAKYVKKHLAASLVSSVPEAWELYSKGKSARGCRKSTNNGRLGSIDKLWQSPCGTWSCEDCAIQKVIPHLCFFHALMSCHAHVFVIVAPVAVVKRDTFRHAVNRSPDFDFEVCAMPDEGGFVPRCPAIGVRVEHNGFAFMYSTGEPTGFLRGLGQWFDSIDGFEHFRTVALALPGVERQPTYINTTGPPSARSEPSGTTMQAAALNEAAESRYLSHREELAYERYDRPYADVLARTPLLTDELCAEANRRARAQTRRL